jgi:hypothetical protein
MILLSAHLDRVIQDFDLKFERGVHTGLLDNFMGVLLTYLTLYDDQNLMRLEREGCLKVWHNKGEEWGRLDNAPRVTKKDIVIVVDGWVMDTNQYDFALDNIWGFSPKEIRSIKGELEWEGFRPMVKRFTGNPDEEDESWSWHKQAGKVLVFSYPIQAKNDGWHRIQQDNTTTAATMFRCQQGLKRLIGNPLFEYLTPQ